MVMYVGFEAASDGAMDCVVSLAKGCCFRRFDLQNTSRNPLASDGEFLFIRGSYTLRNILLVVVLRLKCQHLQLLYYNN